MTTEHKKGLFIVFEGVDGSGKSSQLRAIEKLLIENGVAVTTTREPNGKIREMIMGEEMDKTTETLLFFADRCRNLKEVVLPALERGDVVLCDRYTLSSMVYQGLEGGQQKLVKRLIKEMNQIVTPDIVIFIDVDAEESFSRRVNAGQTNRLDAFNYNRQKKRVEYYCDLAASRSKMFGKYWITVNGNDEPIVVTERIQLMLSLMYGIPGRSFEQTVKGYFSLPENQLKDPMGPNRFIPTDEDDGAFSGKKTVLAGCSETASTLNESKNIDTEIDIDYVLNSENEANEFVKNSNNHELLRTAVCDKVARGIRDISFRKAKSNQAAFQQLIGFVNYIFCCYPTGALFIQDAREVSEFMGVTSNKVFSELLFNPCLNFLNPLIAECNQTAAGELILPVEISQDCVKLRVAKLEAFANKKAKETFEALFSPGVINTLSVLLNRAKQIKMRNSLEVHELVNELIDPVSGLGIYTYLKQLPHLVDGVYDSELYSVPGAENYFKRVMELLDNVYCAPNQIWGNASLTCVLKRISGCCARNKPVQCSSLEELCDTSAKSVFNDELFKLSVNECIENNHKTKARLLTSLVTYMSPGHNVLVFPLALEKGKVILRTIGSPLESPVENFYALLRSYVTPEIDETLKKLAAGEIKFTDL